MYFSIRKKVSILPATGRLAFLPYFIGNQNLKSPSHKKPFGGLTIGKFNFTMHLNENPCYSDSARIRITKFPLAGTHCIGHILSIHSAIVLADNSHCIQFIIARY